MDPNFDGEADRAPSCNRSAILMARSSLPRPQNDGSNIANLTRLRSDDGALPKRIGFRDTLDRCLERGVTDKADADDLRKLMELQNPLSHFRPISDPSNLSRRVFE